MQKLQDIHAFEDVFRKNYSGLYARALRFVQDEAAADEIVQDVFLNLWNKRDEIVIYTSIAAYLHATTVNYALDHIRKKDPGQSWERLFDMQGTQAKNPDSLTTQREVNTVRPLQVLPEVPRAVFVLGHFENLNYKAIALQLSVSAQAVEAQVGKAIKLLRSALPVALFVLVYSLTG